MASLNLQLRQFRLTTALITYRLPDYPAILQEYLWQDLDKAPKFPVLGKFLNYWEENIEGQLHSVKVTSAKLIQPARFRHTDHEFGVH
jgi:uncharacterized protein Usg